MEKQFVSMAEKRRAEMFIHRDKTNKIMDIIKTRFAGHHSLQAAIDIASLRQEITTILNE